MSFDGHSPNFGSEEEVKFASLADREKHLAKLIEHLLDSGMRDGDSYRADNTKASSVADKGKGYASINPNSEMFQRMNKQGLSLA